MIAPEQLQQALNEELKRFSRVIGAELHAIWFTGVIVQDCAAGRVRLTTDSTFKAERIRASYLAQLTEHFQSRWAEITGVDIATRAEDLGAAIGPALMQPDSATPPAPAAPDRSGA